ncbi:hypothetical protein KI387_008712, partial [Taxus chinensis]
MEFWCEVLQDLNKKLKDKWVEITDTLNDISEEFDNAHYKIFNKNIDTLPEDQIKENFKDLVKRDDDVVKTFNSDSIDRLVLCHNFIGRLKKVISKLQRLPAMITKEIETTDVVNHYACGLGDEEIQ